MIKPNNFLCYDKIKSKNDAPKVKLIMVFYVANSWIAKNSMLIFDIHL